MHKEGFSLKSMKVGYSHNPALTIDIQSDNDPHVANWPI